MKTRAILFDLDGTLIDQFKSIHSAFSKTLIQMGFPAPSFDKVKRAVGGSSDITMAKLIGPERADEAVGILRPIFEKEMFNGLFTLPGVNEGLYQLTQAGYKCAVLTNKFGPHARSVCDYLGLSKFFEFTIGATDTEWKKPNIKLTRFALERFGYNSYETIYVGDSPYDFETAINGHLRSYLVATGTHTLEELSTLQSENIFEDFSAFATSLTNKNLL